MPLDFIHSNYNYFFANLGILFILAWGLSRFRIVTYSNSMPPARAAALGLALAGAASALMILPLTFGDGIISDARAVPILISVVLTGPVGLFFCAAGTVAARIAIGGAGMPAGVIYIVTVALTAAAYHFLVGRKLPTLPDNSHLLALAAVATFVSTPAFFFLPPNLQLDAFASIFPANLATNLIGIALLGNLLSKELKQHLAETRLSGALAYQKAIMESAVDGMVVIDRRGVILSCNPMLRTLFGYEEDELVGRNVSMLMPSPHREEHDGYLSRYLDTGDGKIIGIGREVSARGKDGHLFPVHLSVGKGEVAGDVFFVGTLSDISEQVRARSELESSREKLEESYHLLQAVIDTIPVRVFWKDKDLRFLGCNKLFAHDSGLDTPESLVGKSDHEMAWRNEADAYRRDDRAVIESGEARIAYEEKQTTPDGREMWLRTSKIPLRDSYGDVFGVLGTYEDITETKEAEERIRHNEYRLEQSQEFANIGTWDWNIQTGELYWSERIAPMFGGPKAELETSYENFLASIHPDDRQSVVDAVNACVGSGALYNIEHRVVWKDGAVRWLLERGDVVRDRDGKPIKMLGVVQDITRAKEAESALRAAMLETERANQAKSDFLSSMSHELRTPLHAILGFTQLMQIDVEKLDDEQISGLEHIQKAGEHLLRLINEVLDLAKIEAGRMSFEIINVRLFEIFGNCLLLVNSLAEQRGIRITDRTQDIANIYVRADSTRLKQVLLNLLSNAVKYNRAGGSVTLRGEHLHSNMVRILVEDTGLGIPVERQAEVFSAFSRLAMENSEIEGTGIGLTIAQRFMSMMGGEIGFSSTPDEGSVFWIDLQIADPNAEPVRDNLSAQKSIGTDVSNSPFKILYIEDNETSRDLMAQVISKFKNARLQMARTAEIGIGMIEQYPPDIILMDINLAGMDGYEALRWIRKNSASRDVPVIAVSADALPSSIEQGKRAGFAAYLTKPLEISELISTIDRLLQKD